MLMQENGEKKSHPSALGQSIYPLLELRHRIEANLDLSPEVIQHVIDDNPNEANVCLNVHSKTLERHQSLTYYTRSLFGTFSY